MKAELIENIEDYLEGRLSRAELEHRAAAAEVVDLDAEIQWLRDSRTAIEASALREQLREALPPAGGKVRRLRPRRLLLAIAASVLILVAAALWLFSEPAVPALYAEYEYVDPGLPVLMSQSDQYELYDALSYYSEGDYATAAAKLGTLAEESAGSDTLYFYLGASQLYRGQTLPARAALERVLAKPDSEFRRRTEWMLVLTALREEDRAAAQQRLVPILDNPDHPFFDAAQSLNEKW